jgi:prepilin-type N-terminal cleavage/methylation domain-containing protein
MRHRKTPMASGARGFTIIEILIALAITAFGFAAIFSLQIGSVQGNISARDLAAGINLAERYAGLLRSDGTVAVTGALPARLAVGRGRWHSLTPDPVDHNGLSFDDSTLARQRFCVHYWLDEPVGMPNAGAFNARVRVVWPNANLDVGALEEVCPEGAADGFEETPGRFYSVTLPVLVRQDGGGA